MGGGDDPDPAAGEGPDAADPVGEEEGLPGLDSGTVLGAGGGAESTPGGGVNDPDPEPGEGADDESFGGGADSTPGGGATPDDPGE